jgi:hypothetical protein
MWWSPISTTATDGTCTTIQNGALLILDRQSRVVTTLSDPKLLDGPWDLTVHDAGRRATVFVSNVLSGTVTRIQLRTKENGTVVVERMTQIASGYGTACNAGPRRHIVSHGARDVLNLEPIGS